MAIYHLKGFEYVSRRIRLGQKDRIGGHLACHRPVFAAGSYDVDWRPTILDHGGKLKAIH